jgi:DNA polymerase-3 subunit epsilon
MVQKDGTEPKETLDCIADEIASAQNVGIPLVVFNAGFDIPLLESELQRYSLPSLSSRISADSINVLDPMILDIVMNPYRKGRRNLDTLITVYKIGSSGSLHSAEVDSVYTLKVLDSILSENPILLNKTNSEINSLQRTGYENWAKGLNEYRLRIGKVPSMSTKWF